MAEHCHPRDFDCFDSQHHRDAFRRNYLPASGRSSMARMFNPAIVTGTREERFLRQVHWVMSAEGAAGLFTH